MKKAKANVLNSEDSMIGKATLSFLFTPLILLMLTGLMIAA